MTRDEMLFDLFVTAIEGGINYWAAVEDYKPDAVGYSVTVHDQEDPDEGPWVVDRSVMAKGYQLAAGEWRDKISWSSGEKPPLVITEETDWDYDAMDADAILQLGIFGEVVYG